MPVNISKGEQFKPDFLAISPNNRIPAIVDDSPKDGGRSDYGVLNNQLADHEFVAGGTYSIADTARVSLDRSS